MELIQLCNTAKPKQMIFISSTAVLDVDAYLNASNIPTDGIPEWDMLIRSTKGLPTGYGQTKWVSEALMRDAGVRGLNGMILRPGYVTGERDRGTTVTDDFLTRLLKGCIQLGVYPDLGAENFINMMPVDSVAQIVVAATKRMPDGLQTHNAVARTMTFNDFLQVLPESGYKVQKVEYDTWRSVLMEYVAGSAEGKEEHALLPLYHMAVSDLPNDSKSPKLSVNNTAKVLKREGVNVQDLGMNKDLVMKDLAYLCEIGFIQRPEGDKLPKVDLGEGVREALSKMEGRGRI